MRLARFLALLVIAVAVSYAAWHPRPDPGARPAPAWFEVTRTMLMGVKDASVAVDLDPAILPTPRMLATRAANTGVAWVVVVVGVVLGLARRDWNELGKAGLTVLMASAPDIGWAFGVAYLWLATGPRHVDHPSTPPSSRSSTSSPTRRWKIG